MSDYEPQSESDEENEIRDLQKLNAALIDDEPCTSTSISRDFVNTNTFNSKYEEYSKIETVLRLNKLYDDKLRRLETILSLRLVECRHRLNEITKNESNNEDNEKVERFLYVTCGKPYFKDKTNFPAPDNEDTLLMRESGMYDFSNVTSVSGWTKNDKSQFLNVLEKMSQEKKKTELISKIAELRRAGKSQSSTNEKKISILKKKIEIVGKMQLKDIALPLDEDYDWDCVANKLNYRHNALEYRALWKLFLHPSINKTSWSKSEHTSLQNIASAEKLQDWKKIAILLGTGRSGYQCFVYFRTNMSNTFSGKKWTKEEEEYLKRLIEYYKEGDYIPWGRVAASMDNRTKIQIYNKYLRLMEFRKGRFLKEEDAVMLTCHGKFGANFKKMAKFLPGRSAAQCRVRFQILNKKSLSTVWNIEEDRKLVELLCNKNEPVNYSSMAQHFPDKDRQHIRSRCLTLIKWMRNHPNVDIAKAPRRAARHLGHGHSSSDLDSAIQRLKARTQSEVNKQKKKISYTNSTGSEIDDDIIALFEKKKGATNEKAQCSFVIVESDDSDDSHDSDEDQDPPLFDNCDCDIPSLRKILILLRAKLDKKKFMESPYYEKYKGLLEPKRVIAPEIKVKCYSRKKPETTLKVDSAPDIWGTKCLPRTTYVLPPNYSTVNGCKKVLLYTSRESVTREIEVNIKTKLRKNCQFKEQTDLFTERCNTLFLWPMLLAHHQLDENDPQPYVGQNSSKKPPQFDKNDWNAVALPKPKENERHKVNRVIDLDESESRNENEINLDLDNIIQNSNFDSENF